MTTQWQESDRLVVVAGAAAAGDTLDGGGEVGPGLVEADLELLPPLGARGLELGELAARRLLHRAELRDFLFDLELRVGGQPGRLRLVDRELRRDLFQLGVHLVLICAVQTHAPAVVQRVDQRNGATPRPASCARASRGPMACSAT